MSIGVFGSNLPLVAAPMAGGPSSPQLVRAVSAAGGFAFLAAGYLRADALREQILAVRSAVPAFGVNLFVPSTPPLDPDAVLAELSAYAAEIADDARKVAVELPAVETLQLADDDDWEAKLRVLEELPVAVVSFTFGLPAAADVARLQATGARVLATVTTLAEAQDAVALGVDGLVVQGPAAGGHSATFDPARSVPNSASVADTVALVRAVVEWCDLQGLRLVVLGAGGVDGPAAVRDILQAGAAAAVSGTMFLGCSEAGINPAHRAALLGGDYGETIVTRAFTGRPARALRNGFAVSHSASAPVAYPAVHYLTTGMRKAAASVGGVDLVHLWAGSGFSAARECSAGEMVAWLVSQVL